MNTDNTLEHLTTKLEGKTIKKIYLGHSGFFTDIITLELTDGSVVAMVGIEETQYFGDITQVPGYEEAENE